MKKLIMCAAVLLAGCVDPSGRDRFDEVATREQLKKECVNYGGKLNTYSFGSSRVEDNPWTGLCINTSTGNTFNVYVTGVRK